MLKTHMGTLDIEARAEAFGKAYEAYVVPAHFTAEALDRHVTSGDCVLDESPLWLGDDGNPVGLGLLGVRGKRGWIGGFGITKPHRGKRLARALAEEMLRRAETLGLNQVQLEVITINPYAIRTYASCGFRTQRDLLVLGCTAETAAAAGHAPGFVERDWRGLVDTVPAAVPPCWQREPATLAHAKSLVGLAHPDRSDTYAVVSPMPEIANIVALAAPDEASLRLAIAAVAQRFQGLGLRVLNEPEDSPLCPWLESVGFEEKLRQHEMVVPLGG